MMRQKSFYSAGQIGLVVLLITSVLLTIGVGVASQSVVEQKTTRQELESTQTFNAADEGLEWALSQDLSTVGSTYSGADFPGTVDLTSGGSAFSRRIGSGESAQINFSATSSFQVFWPVGETCAASVIVTIFNSSADVIRRNAYSPSCRAGDGFTAATLTGSNLHTPAITPLFNGFARIKVIYTAANVTVSGANLPDQQFTVTSRAERESGEARAVQAQKGLPSLPSIFDYSVFAGVGNIQVSP